MRSLINVKTKSNKQMTSLNKNNQIESNSKTISNAFNELSSQLLDIDNKFIPTNKNHKDYLNVSIVN